eukprot:c18102_g1_i2.p1 GENE.c18102_g1_i2~~c18102_g1_i2.p1  ORF type:complete len:488 (+),score=129.88 c18102_g1_i2:24-1487(+)
MERQSRTEAPAHNPPAAPPPPASKSTAPVTQQQQVKAKRIDASKDPRAIHRRDMERRHKSDQEAKAKAAKQLLLPFNPFRLKRNNKFLINFKFTTSLPELPVDAKLLRYPHKSSRFTNYFTSTLETVLPKQLHTEPDMGIPLDLINPRAYEKPSGGHVALDDKDAALIAPIEQIKAPLQTSRAAALMGMSMEYLNNDLYQRKLPHVSMEASHGASALKHAVNQQQDTKTLGTVIEESFEVAKEPPKHSTKPGLTAVKVTPIFPDFEHWTNRYIQVGFDMDPCEDYPNHSSDACRISFLHSEASAQTQSEAELMLAFKRPTLSSILQTDDLRKHDNIDEERIEKSKYRWVRDYHTDVQQMNEAYVLYTADNVTYYNQVPSKALLSKIGKTNTTEDREAVRKKMFQYKFRNLLPSEVGAQQKRSEGIEGIRQQAEAGSDKMSDEGQQDENRLKGASDDGDDDEEEEEEEEVHAPRRRTRRHHDDDDMED